MSEPLSSRFDRVKVADVVSPGETRDPRSTGKKNFSYVDIASVCNRTFSIKSPKIIAGEDAPSRARKVIKTGDVLYATTRPYLKSIAPVPEPLDNQICSTGFCVLRPSERILPEWLFYCATSEAVLSQIIPLMRGATYPAVTDKDILGAVIPLPPIPEQRRILGRIKECVERIEEIEKLRAETYKERDVLLDSLIEAEFQSAIGEDVVLEDVCGITSELVDPRKPGFIDSIHVGGANIESETGRLIDLKTSREEKLKSAKFPFDPSMVLYNKIRPYLKKVARPDFSGVCSADMYPLSPATAKLDKDYLFFLLLSRDFTRYAIEGSNRAGMPKVNRKHLFAYSFKLPPIDQQKKIAEKLNEALTTLEIMRAEYFAMQTDESHLRDAILRKAFAGEI